MRERAAARRLSRTGGVAPFDALQQVLTQAAAPATLESLVAARLQIQAGHADRRRRRLQAASERHARKQAQRAPDPAAWHAWFDGSALPNPGRLGIGAVLRGPDGTVREISRAVGMGDCNAAEYLALIAVLEAALALRVAHLIVHGDSQVVIQDLAGRVPVRTHSMAVYRECASTLMRQLTTVELVWIPRARNGAADALARDALDGTAAVAIVE